jgi:heptosyltransferase II
MEPQARILVRGVNWLGDAIMTTPALLRLREARPKARIVLLTPQKLEDLWQHHPALDGILSVSPRETLWQVARRLRAEQFHTALILPNSVRSALEVWLAGIRQRIGYAGQWRQWLLTQAVAPADHTVSMRKRSLSEIRLAVRNNVPSTDFSTRSHQLFHYLHLARTLGAASTPLPPQIMVSPEEMLAVMARFSLSSSTANAPWLLGLNAGAEYGPAKRWPVERFIEAAIKIQRQTPCRWLVLGGLADRDLAARVVAEIRQAGTYPTAAGVASRDTGALNLAGQTTLRELCGVLKACRLLLTNDTGPMHVAAAVGTPVVVPFGSTSPALTGPGLPGDSRHCLLRSTAPCAPCFQRVCPIDFRCMLGLEVGQIVSAVLSVLSSMDPLEGR